MAAAEASHQHPEDNSLAVICVNASSQKEGDHDISTAPLCHSHSTNNRSHHNHHHHHHNTTMNDNDEAKYSGDIFRNVLVVLVLVGMVVAACHYGGGCAKDNQDQAGGSDRRASYNIITIPEDQDDEGLEITC